MAPETSHRAASPNDSVRRLNVRLTVTRPSGPSPGTRTATAILSSPTSIAAQRPYTTCMPDAFRVNRTWRARRPQSPVIAKRLILAFTTQPGGARKGRDSSVQSSNGLIEPRHTGADGQHTHQPFLSP